MNKQEFLAMSLPFELKMWNKSEPYKVYEMDGFFPPNAIHYKETNRSDYFYFETKPILRTLSDLTKEIEHKGEKFVPIVKLAEFVNSCRKWKLSSSGLYAISENGDMDFEYDDGYNCFLFNNSAQLDQFKLFKKLIEWHFDIANLIPVGEAIDINTLSINPYK